MSVTTTPTIEFAPEELADDFDPWVAVREAATTPERRLLVEFVTLALNDCVGKSSGIHGRETLQYERRVSAAWLRDPRGVGIYGTAAYCFHHLDIDQNAVIRALEAGRIRPIRSERVGAGKRVVLVKARGAA